MIRLTRLNQVPLVLNSDLIEHIEITPDTVIALTSGQKFMVRETAGEVIERVVEFRRAVLAGLGGYAPGGMAGDSSVGEAALRLVKRRE